MLQGVVQGLAAIASSACQTPEQGGQGVSLHMERHDLDDEQQQQQQQQNFLQAGSLLLSCCSILSSSAAGAAAIPVSCFGHGRGSSAEAQQQQQQHYHHHLQHKRNPQLAAGIVCLLLLPRVLECLVIHGLSLPRRAACKSRWQSCCCPCC